MSNTIETAPNPPAAAPPVTAVTSTLASGVSHAPGSPLPPLRKTRPVSWHVMQGLKALASLRLTVALFVLSLLLVFFGTLAQIDFGFWTVINTYFRWFWVWIPFQ